MEITGLIGSTPLLRLALWERYRGVKAHLYAKWEGANLTGSIKDRAALALIKGGIQSGRLPPTGHLIEASSGNMGISLSAIGAAMGYKVTIVMPEGVSLEREQYMRSFGAELVRTPAPSGMGGAIAVAEEIARETGWYYTRQFEREESLLAHENGTAKELFVQLSQMAIFAAGIGTAGTLIGVGRGLKKRGKNVQIVGVEPTESPCISGGRSNFHGIEGIGAGFVPPLFDGEICQQVLTVSTEEAVETAKDFSRLTGLLIGISAGANLAILTNLGKKNENQGKELATVFPDGGNRYFSKNIF